MDNEFERLKKPFYQRWWFWLVVVLVVLFIIGAAAGGGGETPKSTNPAVSDVTDGKNTTSAAETTKDNLSDIPKEYTLTAGYYTAGVDFPSGTCNVKAVSGKGNLSSSNIYSGGINEMFGIDDGSDMYTESFNGLKLPAKTTLKLNGKLKIKLEFTSVEAGFTGRTYDENAAVTLSNGNYEAGKDFPAGTYKVVAVSGKGNLSSSNLYDGGMNEMFGTGDDSGFYNEQFLNANLEKGVTLKISGGLTIKLIPEIIK